MSFPPKSGERERGERGVSGFERGADGVPEQEGEERENGLHPKSPNPNLARKAGARGQYENEEEW
jgi:hypothetical protein